MFGLNQILTAALAICLATSTAVAASSSDTYCVPRDVSTAEQTTIFQDWVHEFYVVRDVPKAFHTYIMEDFIQHNPFEKPHGALPSQKYLTALYGNMTYGVKVYHMGIDHGIGWVHSRLLHYDPREIAIADIFRFNGSCIQEHWDVIQELPKDATNPIALF